MGGLSEEVTVGQRPEGSEKKSGRKKKEGRVRVKL